MFRFCFSLFLLIAAATSAAESLSKLHIDKKAITVSGISSGAFMAVQLQVAFSSVFSGAASVAGGIYWCAEGDAQRAQTICMSQPANVNVADHVAQAQLWAQSGAIDSLENLRRHKIYIYASPKDAIIAPAHSQKLIDFYAALGSGPVYFENRIASAHGFPTLDQGNPCALGFLPWLLKCNYDGAGEILKNLGAIAATAARGAAHSVALVKFDQQEFDPSKSMFKDGWAYIPERCKAGATCALHVALHGCQMNPDFIQDKFARNAGFNEWAEAGNVVVLYPQSAKKDKVNPYGCWDWFGFTGKNYSTKSGQQMAAIYAMIQRLVD